MGSWNDLINGLNDVVRSDKIIRTALTSTLPVQKKRIFEQGLDTSNSRIGVYGTKPISIARKNQSRNTGHTYFKGGYSQYKTETGKNPGFVNLRNTDQMMMDYGLQKTGNDFGFGFQNSENAAKSGYAEDKYDKEIFALTDSENDLFVNVQAATLKTTLESYL